MASIDWPGSSLGWGIVLCFGARHSHSVSLHRDAGGGGYPCEALASSTGGRGNIQLAASCHRKKKCLLINTSTDLSLRPEHFASTWSVSW